MSKRVGLSKRLRFEIFKRDGFRCIYCGATPVEEPLHVDHVTPVAEGGTNDVANLVTACSACNLGKNAVPLTTKRLASPGGMDDARLEQPAQILAYLAHQREVAAARSEAAKAVEAAWDEHCGRMPGDLPSRIPGLIAQHGLPRVLEAIEVSGRNRNLRNPVAHLRYVYGILRNWRTERAVT